MVSNRLQWPQAPFFYWKQLEGHPSSWAAHDISSGLSCNHTAMQPLPRLVLHPSFFTRFDHEGPLQSASCTPVSDPGDPTPDTKSGWSSTARMPCPEKVLACKAGQTPEMWTTIKLRWPGFELSHLVLSSTSLLLELWSLHFYCILFFKLKFSWLEILYSFRHITYWYDNSLDYTWIQMYYKVIDYIPCAVTSLWLIDFMAGNLYFFFFCYFYFIYLFIFHLFVLVGG